MSHFVLTVQPPTDADAAGGGLLFIAAVDEGPWTCPYSGPFDDRGPVVRGGSGGGLLVGLLVKLVVPVAPRRGWYFGGGA